MSITACARSSSTEPPLEFKPSQQVGKIRSKLIREASGIVASRKNPGVLWVHNDSGDSAKIYAINHKGELLGTYHIKGAHCLDWEDIAIGPSPDSKSDYLYIGDIGDNKAKRSSVTIYRVLEPKVDPNSIIKETAIGPADSITLTYPDGPKDAETLIVDPLNGDIYIIVKRELFSRAYQAQNPTYTDKPKTMNLVASLPLAFATGGDVSPDGKIVIVRGIFSAFMWIRPEGEQLWRAFEQKRFNLKLIYERQGEGICFDADGLGYFTIGEGVNPPIYYFAGSIRHQNPDK